MCIDYYGLPEERLHRHKHQREQSDEALACCFLNLLALLSSVSVAQNHIPTWSIYELKDRRPPFSRGLLLLKVIM